MNPTNIQSVKCRLSNGEVAEVPKCVISASKILRKMIEKAKITDVIKLEQVTPESLKMIIEFCEYHNNDPGSMKDFDKYDPLFNKPKKLAEWDRNFVDVEQNLLFDLIMAADFLKLKQFLDVTTQFVADMIIGKTTEEIRFIYNIEDDFKTTGNELTQKDEDWFELPSN